MSYLHWRRDDYSVYEDKHNRHNKPNIDDLEAYNYNGLGIHSDWCYQESASLGGQHCTPICRAGLWIIRWRDEEIRKKPYVLREVPP
jgi:hypothetical protein